MKKFILSIKLVNKFNVTVSEKIKDFISFNISGIYDFDVS